MAATMSKYESMKRRRRGMIGAGGVAALLLIVGGVALIADGGGDDVPVEVAGQSIEREDPTSTSAVPVEPPVPDGFEMTVVDGRTTLTATTTMPEPPIVTSVSEDADGNLVPTGVGSGAQTALDTEVASIEAGSHPRTAVVTFECRDLETAHIDSVSYEVVDGEFRYESRISGWGYVEGCDEPVALEVPLLEDYVAGLTPVLVLPS